MAPRDGLLEKGIWADITPDSKGPLLERVTKNAVDYLRPSFFSQFWKTTPGRTAKLRRTAYLDGLRGFAAFMVYWGHHHLWSRDAIHIDRIWDNGFGYEHKYYFATLPGIRTFFNGGHYAVTVFFVISGYVLAAKPLSLMHAGNQAQIGENVGSALFRRWLRLFLPLIATTLCYLTFLHVFNIAGSVPQMKSTYREELWTWYLEMKHFSFVFKEGGDPWFSYNFHAWSIPVEFRGSICIYTVLLAISRCSRNARLSIEAALIFYFMYIVDGWYCALFMGGLLLCDLDLLAEEDNLPQWIQSLAPAKKIISYVALSISLFLGGVPSMNNDINNLRKSPGWYHLSFLKPQAVYDYKWFFLFWASTTLVATIPRIPWLKRFFETRFCQYLGRISFAFYLVHGPVLWTLGDRLYAASGWIRVSHAQNFPGWINAFPCSKRGPLGLEPAFVVPHLILLPLTLWLAELVTKMFDEPSVRFPQWLYKRTLA